MKKFLVVGLGEILWDVFQNGKTPGGAPANFAFHASQMGVDGVVVSAIGNDKLGDEIIETLKGKSLRREFQRTPQETGTVQVKLNSAGVAQYTFTPNVAWDNIEFTNALEEIAQKADTVCFGTLAQRSEKSRNSIVRFLKATQPMCCRIFDANLRQNFFSEDTIRNSLEFSTILKINEDELKVFGKIFGTKSERSALAEKLFVELPQLEKIVLTCGPEGSFVEERNRNVSFAPANPEIKIVDTVGAGDSFTAAFVVALLYGKGVPEAHCYAAKVADFVCSQAGGMPQLPDALKTL